jgi:hypothetical protein
MTYRDFTGEGVEMRVEPKIDSKKRPAGRRENLTKAGMGRPKGARNKVSRDFIREIAAKNSYDPLTALIEVAKSDPKRAEEIAWRLMPYFHKPLPVNTDQAEGATKAVTVRLDLG